MITHDELLRRYAYDPDTGVFTNRKTGKRVGGSTFSCSPRQRTYTFWNIKIGGKNYKAHRLAWFYVTGAWPTDIVDHIDGNACNNAWANLRVVTSSQNRLNVSHLSTNTTGYRGVTFVEKTQRFRACCRRKSLGYFKSAEDASAAYERELLRHFA